MALNYTLRIDAGATFVRTFRIKDSATGLPLDLTGFTGKIQIRVPKTLDLAYENIPTIDALAGTVTLRIEATDTSSLTLAKYVWACELYSGVDVFRILEGDVAVSDEVVY